MFYTVEVEKAIKEEKKEGSKDDGGKKSRISLDLDSKHMTKYWTSFKRQLLKNVQKESKDFCTHGH
jgi:hypothetical protein